MNRALQYLHGGSRGITLTVPLTLSNMLHMLDKVKWIQKRNFKDKRQDSHNLRFAKLFCFAKCNL